MGASKDSSGCKWYTGIDNDGWHKGKSWINNFQEDFKISCPSNGIVAGFKSVHSNKYEDRIWNVYCCAVSCRLFLRTFPPHLKSVSTLAKCHERHHLPLCHARELCVFFLCLLFYTCAEKGGWRKNNTTFLDRALRMHSKGINRFCGKARGFFFRSHSLGVAVTTLGNFVCICFCWETQT